MGPSYLFLKSAAVRVAAALAFFVNIFSSSAYSDDVYTFVVKKQEEKARSRWTLSEWLETRDRMRLMDLWLAMNSPSPYEFFFGGVSRIRDSDSAFALQAAAYASIFGLGFERSFSPVAETSAEFLVRVLGYHVQGTHLTLHAGVRSRDSVSGTSNSIRNAYAGFGLSIYLSKFFGLDGLFRRHFVPVPNAAGVSDTSDLFEGGAFIDFAFLRVFFNYGKTSSGLAPVGEQTSVGVRLFF